MSCVHFNTPNQRQQFTDSATDHEPIAQWLGPQVTQFTINRVITMSKDSNVKVREAAATSAHAPEHVYEALSRDEEASVRQWLARNTHAPQHVIEALSDDTDELVKCYLALNHTVPASIINKLTQDPSHKVRVLANWRTQQAA